MRKRKRVLAQAIWASIKANGFAYTWGFPRELKLPTLIPHCQGPIKVILIVLFRIILNGKANFRLPRSGLFFPHKSPGCHSFVKEK